MSTKIVQCYKGNTNLKYFAILGERHSSTNFLEYCIKSNLNIEYSSFLGHKHWIGNCRWEDISNSTNVLFVGIVRNIYDWIGGMRKIPHHLCLNKNNNYETLLSSPFISCDINKKTGKKIFFDDRNFINQTFYKDIFEARYYKNIFLYHYMPLLADNYLLLTFENFTKHHAEIVNFASLFFNLTKTRRYRINKDYRDLGLKSQQYKMPDKIINIINERTYWEAESVFGYKREPLKTGT